MTQNRQPRGIPAGGEFAANSHDEQDASLAGGEGRPSYVPRGYVNEDDLDELHFALESPDEVPESRAYDAIPHLDESTMDRAREIHARYADEDGQVSVEDYPRYRSETRDLIESIDRVPGYENPRYGTRYEEAIGLPLAGVNKLVRRDLKQAQQDGYLPESLKFSVTKGYDGPRVQVSGIPKELMQDRRRLGFTDPAVSEIYDRVRDLAGAYGKPRSEGSYYGDYYDGFREPTVQIDFDD